MAQRRPRQAVDVGRVNRYRLLYLGEVAAARSYGTGFVGENRSRGTYGSPRIP
jgi:hypothetical protein